MWIKICGIRDLSTARVVVDTGADALGLNFFPPSPRSISADEARRIVQQLPADFETVGLFVNQPLEFVLTTAEVCGLSTIQLHGDEPPAYIAQVAARFPMIRAFRVGETGLEPVAQELRQIADREVRLRGALVDAKVLGAYGGTGQKAPWELLVDWGANGWPPLILAGGLNPENVAEAIGQVRPWGVDVAGGVESSRACKDPAMVREFVLRAREAGGGFGS